MTKVDLKYLSEKHREVWRMRYQYGWRISQIALRLGKTEQAVSQLIRRAERRAGLPRRTVRVRIIRTQPRRIGAFSLSNTFNY